MGEKMSNYVNNNKKELCTLFEGGGYLISYTTRFKY